MRRRNLFRWFIACMGVMAFVSARSSFSDDAGRLPAHRKKIDKIDDRLYRLLAMRMETAEKIGRIKTGRRILDAPRESEVLGRLSRKKGLRPDFVSIIWQDIFNESRRIQSSENGAPTEEEALLFTENSEEFMISLS